MNPTSSLANAYHPIRDDRWRELAGEGEHLYRVDAPGRVEKIIRAFSAREAVALFVRIRSLSPREANRLTVRRVSKLPDLSARRNRGYFDVEF